MAAGTAPHARDPGILPARTDSFPLSTDGGGRLPRGRHSRHSRRQLASSRPRGVEGAQHEDSGTEIAIKVAHGLIGTGQRLGLRSMDRSSLSQGEHYPETSISLFEISCFSMPPCLDALPASPPGTGGHSGHAPPRPRHCTPRSPTVRQDYVGPVIGSRALLRSRRSEKSGSTGRSADCPGGLDRPLGIDETGADRYRLDDAVSVVPVAEIAGLALEPAV